MRDEIYVVERSNLSREVERLRLIGRKPVQVRLAKRSHAVMCACLIVL